MTDKNDSAVSAPGLPADPAYFKVLTEIDMIAHMAGNEFEKLLPEGLTQAQFGVLNRLLRLECVETVSELAAAFQVSQPTMSSTVKRLEAKGLVALVAAPNDRRAKHVRVTEAGKKLRNKTVDALAPHYEAFVASAQSIDWESLLPRLTALRAHFESRL